MDDSLSVLVAEPNPLLAEKTAGLAARYEHVWCVAQVSSAQGLERAMRALDPDLVLADLGLLQAAGAAALRRQESSRHLVALVDALSAPYLAAAARLGIDAVVEKSRLGERLAAELHAAALRVRDDAAAAASTLRQPR